MVGGRKGVGVGEQAEGKEQNQKNGRHISVEMAAKRWISHILIKPLRHESTENFKLRDSVP